MQNTLEKWQNHCQANGIMPVGAAARLGIYYEEYQRIIRRQNYLPENTEMLMIRIMENRDLLDQTILKTKLLKEMEKFFKEGLNEKKMITASAPTGHGKSTASRYLAKAYNSKYYFTLTEMQREKKAAAKNFIRDLSRQFGLNEKSVNPQRRLIERLRSDTRTILCIDEAQRLISEDWGYFKVIQDLYDNVPNLSIILLGNFRFYDRMYRSANQTMTGIADEEQFLRRISMVTKLSRLTPNDVKIWLEYNNINFMKPNEHKMLADYFKHRAGLADLEEVRKELIRNVLGHGSKSKLSEISYDDIIAIYKKLHTKIKFKDESGEENVTITKTA